MEPSSPKGKFTVEFTKREIRKDLPTVNVQQERDQAFESGAGMAALITAGIALLIIVVLILILR
jgi:hypothetical protein